MRNCLSDLDTQKSMGPDGMHPQVLRELADVIAESLPTIFERSWRRGEMPEDWRKANVTPIFQKARRRTQGTTGWSASPPSWKDDGAAHSRGHLQASGGKEGYQE